MVGKWSVSGRNDHREPGEPGGRVVPTLYVGTTDHPPSPPQTTEMRTRKRASDDDPLIELCDSLRGLEAWQADALCREYPHLSWFVERGQPIAEQLQVCGRCLVRVECLEHALAVPEYVGIWGGHSALSIRNMRRLRTLRRRAGLPELHAADLEHAARRHPSTPEADDAA